MPQALGSEAASGGGLGLRPATPALHGESEHVCILKGLRPGPEHTPSGTRWCPSRVAGVAVSSLPRICNPSYNR
eukprot:scaffold191203_cov40-Tisochrysis_lutea.AAC.3